MLINKLGWFVGFPHTKPSKGYVFSKLLQLWRYQEVPNNELHIPPPGGQHVNFSGITGAASASVFGILDIFSHKFDISFKPIHQLKFSRLKAQQYKWTWDFAVQIVKNEGSKGLYKGTVPRLGRLLLDVSITFTLYDYIAKAILYVWPDKKCN